MARRNENAISNEEIIAALLNSSSIQQAAQAVGISARTIYDRMSDRDFKAAYTAAKGDVIRAAVVTMNRSLSDAVSVVTGIMNNEMNSAATRLQAAKMIFENAAKFADRLNICDRETAFYAMSPLSMDIEKWE